VVANLFRKEKEPIVHCDKLGKELAVNDCVAYADHNSLEIGTVLKLNPKMVKVARVGSKGYWSRGTNKYPMDLLKLEQEEVTIYLLRNVK